MMHSILGSGAHALVSRYVGFVAHLNTVSVRPFFALGSRHIRNRSVSAREDVWNFVLWVGAFVFDFLICVQFVFKFGCGPGLAQASSIDLLGINQRHSCLFCGCCCWML